MTEDGRVGDAPALSGSPRRRLARFLARRPRAAPRPHAVGAAALAPRRLHRLARRAADHVAVPQRDGRRVHRDGHRPVARELPHDHRHARLQGRRGAHDRRRDRGDGHRPRHRAAGVLLHGQGGDDAVAPRARHRGHDAAVGRLPREGLRVARHAQPRERAHPRRCSACSPGYGLWGTIIVLSYLWLPYMVIPIYAGLDRLPNSLLEASTDLGGKAGPHLPLGGAAAAGAVDRGGVDLHVLAHAGRLLRQPAARRHDAVHRQQHLQQLRRQPAPRGRLRRRCRS